MVERKEKRKKEPEHNPELKIPIDPKRVLKILEFRRKTAEFVEAMLEPNITLESLEAGEEFICQSDYDSIVQERCLLKICGYPLCAKELTREWKQKFHISVREKRIYDVEIRKLYCSSKCMDSSIQYRDQKIPEQPIWMRLGEVNLDSNFEIQTPSP